MMITKDYDKVDDKKLKGQSKNNSSESRTIQEIDFSRFYTIVLNISQYLITNNFDNFGRKNDIHLLKRWYDLILFFFLPKLVKK